MSDPRDIFNAFQEQERRARENRLSSGLINALLDISVDLEEDDVDTALTTLEQIGVSDLIAHRSTLPESVLPMVDVLVHVYEALKRHSAEPFELNERIRSVLYADDGTDLSPEIS